jgi:hypothetical protein
MLLMSPIWSTAQQPDTVKKSSVTGQVVTRISGQVIDAVSGQPLPAISIRLMNSGYGTSSDKAGKFDLSAPGSFSRVIFSFVGYQSVTKDVKAGQTNQLQIRLHTSETALKEVEIVSGAHGRYRNKGNPAVALIQQIINHKAENRMESSEYPFTTCHPS